MRLVCIVCLLTTFSVSPGLDIWHLPFALSISTCGKSSPHEHGPTREGIHNFRGTAVDDSPSHVNNERKWRHALTTTLGGERGNLTWKLTMPCVVIFCNGRNRNVMRSRFKFGRQCLLNKWLLIFVLIIDVLIPNFFPEK